MTESNTGALRCPHCQGPAVRGPVVDGLGLAVCPGCRRLGIAAGDELRRPTIPEARALHEKPAVREALNMATPESIRAEKGRAVRRAGVTR